MHPLESPLILSVVYLVPAEFFYKGDCTFYLTKVQNVAEREKIKNLEKRNREFLGADLIKKVKSDRELISLFLNNQNLDEDALFQRCREIVLKHCFRDIGEMDSSELNRLRESQER